MSIRIIITGGTFDKHYDEINGTLTFKDTHLPEILTQLRTTVPLELEINQLIDSLDMQMPNRLDVYDGSSRSRLSKRDGLNEKNAMDIVEAPDGTVCFATGKGVSCLRPE